MEITKRTDDLSDPAASYTSVYHRWGTEIPARGRADLVEVGEARFSEGSEIVLRKSLRITVPGFGGNMGDNDDANYLAAKALAECLPEAIKFYEDLV